MCMTTPADVPPPQPGSEPKVTVTPWICPVCEGKPNEVGCLYCSRVGLTDQPAGWEPDELTPAARPPGVMRRPCAGCAFREGSPEQERDYELAGLRNPDNPFWCHEGIDVIEGSYTPAAWYKPHPDGPAIPLGLKLCAGWWDWRAHGALPPDKPYRDTERS